MAGGGPAGSRGAVRSDRLDQPRPFAAPVIDDDVTGQELDKDVRRELSTLASGVAGTVARHLVMAGQLLDVDPAAAHAHGRQAARMAGRVGVVREAAGLAAYAAGEYAQALADLRAARRMTGSDEYLPVMADCERGLGRPRRALDLAAEPAVARLDPATRIEILIVAAGARRDLGQADAAVVALQIPALDSRSTAPWVARLRYAYADALLGAGRRDDAARWFLRAAEADREQLTDAEERVAELEGIAFVEDDEQE